MRQRKLHRPGNEPAERTRKTRPSIHTEQESPLSYRQIEHLIIHRVLGGGLRRVLPQQREIIGLRINAAIVNTAK